jgi:hypothetical protein
MRRNAFVTQKSRVVFTGTLRPGMKLAESIVDARRRLILREGTALSVSMIENLPIWGVHAVAIIDLSPATRMAIENVAGARPRRQAR